MILKNRVKNILNSFGWYNLNSSNKHRFVKEMYEETRAMIQIQPLVDQVLLEHSEYTTINCEQQICSISNDKPKLFQYWHQGVNEIPGIVRNCYSSVDHFLSDHFEIIRIEHSTLTNYIELPPHILKAREEERMTIAHFSDIIRNKLLLEYGGLWLDSTVLITGKEDVLEFTSLNNRLMFSRFVFSNPKEHAVQFESWIMHSGKSGNRLWQIADQVLSEYWKKHKSINNYFLYHIVLTSILLKIPQIKDDFGWYNRFYLGNSLDLGRYLIGVEFNFKQLKEIKKKTDIHKLDFKVQDFESGTFGDYFGKDLFNDYIIN
jgi:hypothetical protein